LPITDGLSEVDEPRFDASGNYLYFLASTDAGPVKQWFDMSNADLRASFSLYLAVLKKDLPNPFAKESDEEKAGGIKEAPGQPEARATGKTEKRSGPSTGQEKPADLASQTVIDFEGLEFRIVSLPIPPGNYSSLQTGEAGQIYFLEFPTMAIGAMVAGSRDRAQSARLHKFDLKTRKDEVIMEGLNNYLISADKKKILYVAQNTWGITKPQWENPGGTGEKYNVDTIEVKINPAEEWRQIFNEAWRINRGFLL